MAKAPPVVLTDDDLNRTDRRILDLLAEGRVTPPLVAQRLDLSREYASSRLIRLKEHDHVDRLAPGLYELVDDPRSSSTAEKSESSDRLHQAYNALDRALEELPADVPGRAAVEDARRLLKETDA
jgi:hypothetical protein